MMKKVLACLLVLIFSFSLVACDMSSSTSKKLANDEFSLDAICVDNSTEDADGKVNVLMFFKVTAKENIGFTPFGHMSLVIGDSKYSAFYSQGDYENIFPSYCYDNSYVTVEAGDTESFLATYEISLSTLRSGQKITIDSFTPNTDGIEFSTDDIQYFDSLEELLMEIDYEGYTQYQSDIQLREPADSATVSRVRTALVLDGNTVWEVGTDANYRFFNNGTVEIIGSMNLTGTYTITKGYVLCDFDWTKAEFSYYFDNNGNFVLNSTK